MWDHRARVTSIHDGDTITVYQDEGRSEFAELDIRLFGTFAPELKQTGGPETLAFAQQWVADRTKKSVDWPFVLVLIRNKSNTKEEQTFGRWVGMLWTADMTECLNVAVSAFVLANGYPGGIGSTTSILATKNSL